MHVVDLLLQLSYEWDHYKRYNRLAAQITLSLRDKLSLSQEEGRLGESQTKIMKDIVGRHSELQDNSQSWELVYHQKTRGPGT